MLLRLHMLFKRLLQRGLPVRAAVFAWSAGYAKFFSALCLALCFIAFTHISTAAETKSNAPVKSTALHVTEPRPISDGMELIRLGISNNMCALTFDDGPGPYTAKLLDVLAKHKVPATFFVVGTQVQRRPELIKRMLAEGHEVGNHSYSHTALRNRSPQAQHDDLIKLDHLLRDLGAKPRFVRPPFGFYDHNTINTVQEMDGHIVMWTADSEDWRNTEDVNDILTNMQMIYRGAPLRGVFLFHDTHRPTVEHMDEILNALVAAGCRFVTLSEYIDTPKSESDIPISLEAKALPPVNFILEGRLDFKPEKTAAATPSPGGRQEQPAVTTDAETAKAQMTEQNVPINQPGEAVKTSAAETGPEKLAESAATPVPDVAAQKARAESVVKAAGKANALAHNARTEKAEPKNIGNAAQAHAENAPEAQDIWHKPLRDKDKAAGQKEDTQNAAQGGRFSPVRDKTPLTLSAPPQRGAAPVEDTAVVPPMEHLAPLASPPRPPDAPTPIRKESSTPSPPPVSSS